MKKPIENFISCWCLLFLISGMPSTFYGQDVTFEIMTYNIRLDYAGDGPDNWHYRKAELAAYILAERPDFLGIQEGLSHQVHYLDSLLMDYDYFGVGRDDGDAAGEFMAIFYRNDRWELLEKETYWLSGTPAIPSRGWDAACNRVVTVGIFSDALDNRVCLLNTHLDHVGEKARSNSVQLIDSLVLRYGTVNPLVLTGDFNLTPDDPLYYKLSGMLQDASQISGNSQMKQQGTFNGFKIQGDFPRRIDYIFTNERLEALQYRVDQPKSGLGRQLSDHFPVLAILKFI